MRRLTLLVTGVAALVACSSSSAGGASDPAGDAGGGASSGSSDAGGGDAIGGDSADGGDASAIDPIGPTAISGNAGGTAVKFVNAFAYYGEVYSNGTTHTRGVRLVLSDKPNTCASLHFADSMYLGMDIAGDPVPTATYALFDYLTLPRDTGPAIATVSTYDGACASTGHRGAISGSIVITASSATHVRGTVDLTFATGNVTGTFDAILCVAPPPPRNGSCLP